MIPFCSKANLIIEPAATIEAVNLPEKCPPPLASSYPE